MKASRAAAVQAQAAMSVSENVAWLVESQQRLENEVATLKQAVETLLACLPESAVNNHNGGAPAADKPKATK